MSHFRYDRKLSGVNVIENETKSSCSFEMFCFCLLSEIQDHSNNKYHNYLE